MAGLFDDIPVAAQPDGSAQPDLVVTPGRGAGPPAQGLFDDIPVVAQPPVSQQATLKPGLFDDIPAGSTIEGTSGDPLGDLENMAPADKVYRPMTDVPARAIDLNEKVAKGLTLGFAPRLGALADSDPIGKAFGFDKDAPSYDQSLADRNATDERISTEMPLESKLAEGAGSVLGLMVPGGAAADAVRGAGLVGRVGAGAATGAALGGVQGASQSSDLTDIPQTEQDALTGSKTGAAFGSVLPVAGAAFGGAYRAAAPFFTEAPAGLNRMAAALMGNAATPQTADRLASLGRFGMLSDVSPSMLGLTQGIAAKAGPSADIVVNALSNRAAGQSDRLLGSLDDNLGPAFSPRQAETMMSDRQVAASPMYNNALRNAPSIDILPVVQQLENARLYAKGTDAARLDRFGTLLQGPQRVNGVAQPEYDATALHRAKMEMDAQIATTANQTGSAAATATRDMVGVRSALNSALESQVPGYGAANLAYGTAARGGEAFDAGRQALKPGANTLWPQDLDHQFATMPLEQQALMRSGARSDIAADLGTNLNDLSALYKTVGGENDFNRAKMQTLFGPKQTKNVVQDVGNERTFADTYTKVALGAQSAQRLGNSAMLDAADTPAQPVFPKSASMTGLLSHGGEYLVRKGFGALAKASSDSTRDAMARMLISGVPEATTNLQALSDALVNRGQTASAITSALSHRAALAAALSGYREATQ